MNRITINKKQPLRNQCMYTHQPHNSWSSIIQIFLLYTFVRNKWRNSNSILLAKTIPNCKCLCIPPRSAFSELYTIITKHDNSLDLAMPMIRNLKQFKTNSNANDKKSKTVQDKRKKWQTSSVRNFHLHVEHSSRNDQEFSTPLKQYWIYLFLKW